MDSGVWIAPETRIMYSLVFLQSWHFLGNMEDALCREPQNDRLRGTVLLVATKKAKQQRMDWKRKAAHCMARELVSQKHNTTQQIRL